MSIIQFFRILWARRYIVMMASISCIVGAFIVTQLLPPRYEGQSRVMLDLVKPDPITGAIISSQFAKVYTRTQVELIKDYKVAGSVVDKLGWTSDPNMLAQYQGRSKSDDRDFRRWLAQRIIDGTEARLIEGSNILEITYTGSTPEMARTVADTLREAYIDTSLASRRESAKRTAAWFEIQTQKAKAVLDTAEAAKTAYERENGIILSDDKTDIDSQRLQALAGAGASPSVFAPMTSSVTPSSSMLAQLDSAIGQASQTLGPNHPDLLAMKERRTLVASQVAQERSAMAGMAGASAAAARAGAGMLEAQKAKVIGQRDKLERLRQLQSAVDLSRDQFNRSATRTAELNQEAEIGEVGLTAMGNAVTPQKPSFPNSPLIMTGATGFGVGFGVVVALLMELFGRRVRSTEDLSNAVSAPMLAVIPAAPKLPSRRPSPFRIARRPGPRRQNVARA